MVTGTTFLALKVTGQVISMSVILKRVNLMGNGTYYYGPNRKERILRKKYVGEWKNDKFNGQGTYFFNDGAKYVGEFKDGLSHGQGTQIWNNGDKYVGEWKDDKKTRTRHLLFLKMEKSMLVNGKIVKQMGMENIHGQMAMFIKVILKTIIVMVKEQKFTQMVMLEKVNGLTMFIRPIVNL